MIEPPMQDVSLGDFPFAVHDLDQSHRISSRVLEESEHRDAWHFKSRGVYCASPGLNLLEFLRHIFNTDVDTLFGRIGAESRGNRGRDRNAQLCVLTAIPTKHVRVELLQNSDVWPCEIQEDD